MVPGKEILPLKAINIKILNKQKEYKTGAKVFLRFIPVDASNHLGPLLDPLPTPWPLCVGVVLGLGRQAQKAPGDQSSDTGWQPALLVKFFWHGSNEKGSVQPSHPNSTPVL